MSCTDMILERVERVTALGLRFWDTVTNSAVGKGLKVEAYPAGESSRRMGSFLTVGGFHAFRGLPGMREVETGAVDLHLAPRRPFVIEVSDLTGKRFLPFSITPSLPVAGLFPWDDGPGASPLGSPLQERPAPVPLFSTASRYVPAGLAVVRADMWDAISDTPARGALLEVSAPGVPAVRGMADEKGRVAVLLPYPEPVTPLSSIGSPLNSPLSGSAGPLTKQEWPVRLRAFYEPRSCEDFPDLARALRQQPAELQAVAPNNQPSVETLLRYGQELIVRTRGGSFSRLYVTPTAASPP